MSGPILASRDESRRLEALSIAHSPLVSAPAPAAAKSAHGLRRATGLGAFQRARDSRSAPAARAITRPPGSFLRPALLLLLTGLSPRCLQVG